MGSVSNCSRIKSKKSPASGPGNVSEPKQMLEVGRIRDVEVCFCSQSGGGASIGLLT